MTKPIWRLLHTQPKNGPYNMALDEAILECVGKRISPPTLRLYAWAPPCLSLGYTQSINDIDLDQLASLNWDIVRRPTGGRAILHTDELTYSVIAPLDDPIVRGTVVESYQRIAQGFLEALRRLDLDAAADEKYLLRDGIRPRGPVCFEVPSNYEITVGGKKLIGSAQARRRDGVLQHGSIPLTGDLSRITRVLRYDDETARFTAAQRLLNHAITVENALGKQINFDRVGQAIVQSFQDVFDIQFVETTPSDEELTRMIEFIKEKYSSSQWTARN